MSVARMRFFTKTSAGARSDRLRLIACAFLFGSTILFSERIVANDVAGTASENTRVATRVEWRSGTITIDLTRGVPATGANLAVARYRAEERIREDLSELVRLALAPVRITSRYGIDEFITANPSRLVELERFARAGTKVFSHPSNDLSSLTVRYTYRLFPDFAALFVNHTRPYSPARTLGYAQSVEHTGIVVYAKGAFPVHGERRLTNLVPALFPSIRDANMSPVLVPEMLEPEILRSRGVVTYTDREDPGSIEEIAGTRPLVIMPVGLFGISPSDIVISVADAARLLSDEHTRGLLTSGRILVVCDLEE